MINVTVINGKDAIKYLVRIVIAIIIVGTLARYFCMLKENNNTNISLINENNEKNEDKFDKGKLNKNKLDENESSKSKSNENESNNEIKNNNENNEDSNVLNNKEINKNNKSKESNLLIACIDNVIPLIQFLEEDDTKVPKYEVTLTKELRNI